MSMRTERTQARLATAFKEELATTALDRVTVARLSTRAGISRQTFYYHFADVRDLAIWVFTSEVADHILAHASHERWAEGLLELLEYLRAHRDQTAVVTDSLPLRQLERFLHAQLRTMMEAVVRDVLAASPGLIVREEDRDFVVQHYTLAVLGHVLHWLATGMSTEPSWLVPRLARILEGNVVASLERLAADALRGGDRDSARR